MISSDACRSFRICSMWMDLGGLDVFGC
uniref:Uncharacterized protein n=1 Tax=Arundo donax TaxID=35708 RepID=A0A0A8ZP49_ARUDO